MTPRKYDMDARAAGTEATRASIIEAAMRLHASRGMRRTTWPAIAHEADLSPATVYRHFPTASDLVPACARMVFDLVRPPTPAEAAVQFATMDDAADRFAHLAAESAHCYERGEGWLHAAHRERDFDPDVEAALTLFQDSLRVLVDAAAGRRPSPVVRAELFTLCDFPFWKSLVDAGLTHRAAERALVGLVRAEASRLGLSRQESS
jgi:AcrR family transcriptional regulator